MVRAILAAAAATWLLAYGASQMAGIAQAAETRQARAALALAP